MTKNLTKGFTLIELLVVIAIIGMLSAVVLASLNTARGKGSNAAVKEDMNNMRSQAQIVYENNNGSYKLPNDTCLDANVTKALDAASNAGAGNTTSDVCNSIATSWAAEAPLKLAEGVNAYWCTDSNGSSKGEQNALGALTACQ